MKKPKNYKLKITLLSPVHIGTGDDFELTNYVIDAFKKDNKTYYRLFEFNEEDFFEKLSPKEQAKFLDIINKNDLRMIYKYIKEHKKEAKDVSFRQVPVLPEFAKEYKQKVGKFVQIEGKQKNGIINELRIAKTYINVNTNNPIIPGSSIKGSISTAYQEMIYKTQGQHKFKDKFQNKNMQYNIFRHLQISDTKVLKQGISIGYAVNRERFEEDDGALSTRVEYIVQGSEFEIDIKIDESSEVSIQNIITSANEHYKPIFDSLFSKEEYIKELLSPSFLQLQNIKLEKNQFLLRVGKHSGARAVTIDGLRKIKVHISGKKGRNAKYNFNEKEETTVWLRGFKNNSTSNMLPFGWILCEIVEDTKNLDNTIINFVVKNTDLQKLNIKDLKNYLFEEFDKIDENILNELEALYDIDNFSKIEELLVKYFKNSINANEINEL